MSKPQPSHAIKSRNPNPDFWRNKRVFLTGHTGFKGGWLTLWLSMLGAKVTGYSLPPNTTPSLYDLVNIEASLTLNHLADINNTTTLSAALTESNPEIILHLAAQPLVRRSYDNPVETFQTNIIGTARLLQIARNCATLKAIVVITSDKCYENQSWQWGYRETDVLGGYDPYSSSKACKELVVAAFRRSYFQDKGVAIATARAGNAIGGGDWSEHRLIPDAMRAYFAKKKLTIRSPHATRPWQHVLEPLNGYLILAEQLYLGQSYAEAWNFGPQDNSVRTVAEVLEIFSESLPEKLRWNVDSSVHPHEASILKLDCSKSIALLKWRPRWSLEESIAQTSHWYKQCISMSNMEAISRAQITRYLQS